MERPIILRGMQIKAAREGRRTHICLAANFVRSGGKILPTPWRELVEGDKLWVQEETSYAIDLQNPLNTRGCYRADLLGGFAPIPTSNGARRGRWARRNYDAKKMRRDMSRYTLRVVSAKLFRCQEVDWETIKAEAGIHYPADSKGQWWDRHYGFPLPWRTNPEVIGLTFEFLHESIDGVPAPDWRKPVNEATIKALASIGSPKPAPDPEPSWHMRDGN